MLESSQIDLQILLQSFLKLKKMLRTRSRTVATKQSLMADHNSVPSPKPNQTTPMSSFFRSPRLFTRFFSKGVTDFQTTIRPTLKFVSPRVLSFNTPFGYYDQNIIKSNRTATQKKQYSEDKRTGLALLINLLNDEKSHDHKFNITKPNSHTKVQLGSKVMSHIATLPRPATPGTNTQKSRFSDDLAPSSGLNTGLQPNESPYVSTACLSWSEMELSEDYTCVISHGPNPKTTRIFDNCIVEACSGVDALFDFKREYNSGSPSQSFLSSCHTCKKNLGEGKDIYIYKGEKAFCSDECRSAEMVLDEMKNSEMDKMAF